MKKNLGKKNWMFPMPVLMIGTYGAGVSLLSEGRIVTLWKE